MTNRSLFELALLAGTGCMLLTGQPGAGLVVGMVTLAVLSSVSVLISLLR